MDVDWYIWISNFELNSWLGNMLKIERCSSNTLRKFTSNVALFTLGRLRPYTCPNELALSFCVVYLFKKGECEFNEHRRALSANDVQKMCFLYYLRISVYTKESSSPEIFIRSFEFRMQVLHIKNKNPPSSSRCALECSSQKILLFRCRLSYFVLRFLHRIYCLIRLTPSTIFPISTFSLLKNADKLYDEFV